MSLAAPGTNPASNLELKLPHTIGSANQLLKVDANGQLGWADDNSGLSLSNDANNRVVTGTGSGLNAEANLTFTGSILHLTGDLAVSTANRIYFGNSDVAWVKGEHGGSGYLQFGVNTEHMRLLRSGYLGLGVTNPTAKLEIHNGSNIEVLRIKDTHFNKYLTIRGGGSPNRMVIDSYEGGGGGADIDFASNGSTKVRIKSSGVTEFGSNGNYGANPRTVSIGSRTQNIFAPLAIARGEVIGGGTGPLMEFIHGPDSGTQRIHQLYSYVGDFRIFADANENMELRGANIIMKDGNSNEKVRVNSNGIIGVNIASPTVGYGGDVGLHIHSSATSGTRGSSIHLTSGTSGTTAADGSRINTSDNDLVIQNMENGRLDLGTNGAHRLTIKGDGKIGINGDSPVNLLTISNSGQQTDSVGNLQIRYTGSESTYNSGLTTKSYSGTGQFMQWSTGGLRIGSRIITNSGIGNLYFTTGNDSVRAQLTGDGLILNGSDTAAANALSDYEEGTYTATLTCLTSGTITVNSSNDQLYYTKIGRVVYVTGRIRVSAVSSPNGAQLRLNLPIVSAAGTEESGRVIGWVQVQGAAKDVQDYTSQPTAGGNTYIQIGFSDNTIFTGDICGDINTSTKIAVNFHYVT